MGGRAGGTLNIQQGTNGVWLNNKLLKLQRGRQTAAAFAERAADHGINQPQEKSCRDICAKLLSWR
jgi:hypothetical protein